MNEIPYCPIPAERISDVVPMLVVSALFLMGAWLIRRWKQRRKKGSTEGHDES